MQHIISLLCFNFPLASTCCHYVNTPNRGHKIQQIVQARHTACWNAIHRQVKHTFSVIFAMKLKIVAKKCATHVCRVCQTRIEKLISESIAFNPLHTRSPLLINYQLCIQLEYCAVKGTPCGESVDGEEANANEVRLLVASTGGNSNALVCDRWNALNRAKWPAKWGSRLFPLRTLALALSFFRSH